MHINAVERGNATMQIWLSKNTLGYTDKQDIDVAVSWDHKTTEEVMEAAAQALRDAGWTVEPPK